MVFFFPFFFTGHCNDTLYTIECASRQQIAMLPILRHYNTYNSFKIAAPCYGESLALLFSWMHGLRYDKVSAVTIRKGKWVMLTNWLSKPSLWTRIPSRIQEQAECSRSIFLTVKRSKIQSIREFHRPFYKPYRTMLIALFFFSWLLHLICKNMEKTNKKNAWRGYCQRI